MVGPPSTDCRPRAHIAGAAPDRAARPARWIRIPPQIDPDTALPKLGVHDTITAGPPQPH
jgi:hypothetical protein